MVEYPVKFSAEAVFSGDFNVETYEGLETEITVPEEFGGDSQNPSPEDLFNASLCSCLAATFKVTAQRKDLTFSEIKVSSETELDRGEDGRPVMKKAEIQAEVKGVEDRDQAEKVAEISEKNCFIHNSIKTEVETDFEFN